MTLDSVDREILALLQTDCKQNISSIADAVGKGISTVHSRIKSMENPDVIMGYKAVVNPHAVGRDVLAFILTTVRYRVPGQQKVLSQREFCRQIAQHPLVLGVYVLSGEYDVLLKVRAKDIEELNHFIVEFLREIPAVDKTLTMFAMETFLDSLELRNI